MASVVRCWKAEYQKCKHSILLYMHSMIPIICAAIFAGYYHISRWELATKISAYDEISYNGLTYTITDECLEMSELQEEIGQVSRRFKNVAGEDFSFGYVYSIVDVDISNAVAVNINNEYRKADIKNNDELVWFQRWEGAKEGDYSREQCYLNKENVTQFSYKGKDYTILADTVSNSGLGEWIGYIQQLAAVDESGKILLQENLKTATFQTLADLADLVDKAPNDAYIILMAVNSLLVIIILTARFAKNLRTQLTPLFEATAEVSKQNLDFEVGHAKIKEFEDVLASFSDMKDNLKISLERQWKTEQTQKEQIAALAHDLKTPLTVIQGNADLLTETNLDDEQRLYAGYVVESSGQMQSYIQTLIDISRAAVGYQLHIESIDLPAFMQHLFGYMESLCRTKEIRLQMNTVSLPQMLKFDRMLIERAIMNVISNGLDYSPQGGTLYVDVQSNNGFVEISVTDEGTGFSKEALCHAQERFYMGDQSRNSKLHFGMGLYITNSIMEQHNGQLILENSKETGGAKVTMKLPC